MEKGYHLVLAVTSLHNHLVLRCYDMQLDFDLNTLSIEDSQRCASQRDLARTPTTHKMLVHISYVYMYSKLSPFYRLHGTEVIVEFAELSLNVDSKGLLHLRPFYEVLMGRRDVPRPHEKDKNAIDPVAARLSRALLYATEMMAREQSIKGKQNMNGILPKVQSVKDITKGIQLLDPLSPPRTMHVTCTLGKISLDMLNALSENTTKHTYDMNHHGNKQEHLLDSMFCLAITDLRADIVMSDLMTAYVKLISVDVLDRRDLSRDYAFKTILKPDSQRSEEDVGIKFSSLNMNYSHTTTTTATADSNNFNHSNFNHSEFDTQSDGNNSSHLHPMNNSNSKLSSHPLAASSTTSSSTYSYTQISTGQEQSSISQKEEEEKDFLTISYTQESTSAAFVDIIVRDVTTLLSLDAVLDLINVSVANSFAVLDLLAPVQINMSTTNILLDHSAMIQNPSMNNNDALANTTVYDPRIGKPLQPYTMSVRVRIPNSRLIFLEDPTTLESRAIVGRCGLEATYVRVVKGGYTREIHEALHVSTYETEVYVLANMQKWTPLQILEPLGVEFHLTRVLEQGVVVSVGMCKYEYDIFYYSL